MLRRDIECGKLTRRYNSANMLAKGRAVYATLNRGMPHPCPKPNLR